MQSITTRTAALAALGIAALVVGGCPTTRQAGSVERRGFLRDYSRLQKGADGQALERWVNPAADWSGYTSVVLEPVQIWAAKDTELFELSAEERKALLDYLHAAMARELGQVIQVVERPGEGTIRVRLALTGAESSSAALDTVSTVLPIGLALSGLKSLATGRASFVGAAMVEAELTDARSGITLAQAVDQRFGGKSLGGATSSWSDAQEAFDFWAAGMAKFVDEQQAGEAGE
jgi:uncharacterized protein DUF3313